MSKNPCIGIDLGTTNSVIAYFNPQTDSVEIIPNSHGDRLTPSCVLFNQDELLVGQFALEAVDNENENKLISHVKRFIGQKQYQCMDILQNLEYPVDIDTDDDPVK